MPMEGIDVLEDENTRTFLWLCAAEWHAISYGFTDALDGKPICEASFRENIALYSPEDRAALCSRYHYYRFSGAVLAYVKGHWVVITTGVMACVAALGYTKVMT